MRNLMIVLLGLYIWVGVGCVVALLDYREAHGESPRNITVATALFAWPILVGAIIFDEFAEGRANE